MLFASLLISLTAVYADEVGCCINPGAGILACTTQKLVQRDAECCPKPETSFPSYYDTETLGPSSYNNCVDNFFFIICHIDDIFSPFPALLARTYIDRGHAHKRTLSDSDAGIADDTV